MQESERLPLLRMSSDSEPEYDLYFEYFVGSYRPSILSVSREWRPAADIYETATSIRIRVDLAGVEKEDVQVILDKDQVILSGVRREVLDGESKRALAMEVPYGAFRRVFDLPSSVCADDAHAVYERGFLCITLQKRDKPSPRKRNVRIH